MLYRTSLSSDLGRGEADLQISHIYENSGGEKEYATC